MTSATLFRWILSIAIALLSFAGSATSSRAENLLPGTSATYGILFEGNGGNQLQYNNSNLTGNIGIWNGGSGNSGQFAGNGPGTINGNINFSTANTGQFSNSGLTINGAVQYSQPDVGSNLSALNSISQTLGLEAGTSTTIAKGGSISASSGTLDGNGNRVFTVSSISFPNGTFTINGAASDTVVLNIAGGVGSNGLNGNVVLAGGIAPDHVLFNYTPDTSNHTTYNNDYATLSGGPTMTISTNGLTTTGIFLDPTGAIQVNHCNINGWIFGGDTHNLGFVSGANLTVPVPEPGTIVLAFVTFAGFGLAALRRKRN
jgi:hypothetical protein